MCRLRVSSLELRVQDVFRYEVSKAARRGVDLSGVSLALCSVQVGV